jgi:hypothetical protein
MRPSLAAAIVGLWLAAPSLGAQQTSSPEAARLTLPSPFVSPIPPVWSTPDVKRLGIFSLAPTDISRGEVVRVAVPVGDLVSRAAHAVTSAQHRRAERKAREQVVRELQTFLARQPQ